MIEHAYINRNITPHFFYDEPNILCPCCGELIINDLFLRTMFRIEKVRVAVGFPLVFNSGHRCEKHNRKVGGAKRSMHLSFAADLRPEDKKNFPDFCNAIKLMNHDHKLFNGVGWYWSFVHLDCRTTPYTWDNRKSGAIKR